MDHIFVHIKEGVVGREIFLIFLEDEVAQRGINHTNSLLLLSLYINNTFLT